MKASGVCPKCHHNQLLHVTQVADRAGDAGVISTTSGTSRAPESGPFYPWRLARVPNASSLGIFSSQIQAAGLVEAFVCRRCGLTEFYTTYPDDIPADGDLVREISGPSGAPFR